MIEQHEPEPKDTSFTPAVDAETEGRREFLERFEKLPFIVEFSRRSGNPDLMQIGVMPTEQTEHVHPGRMESMTSFLRIMQEEGHLAEAQVSQLFKEDGSFDMSAANWAKLAGWLDKRAVLHFSWDGGGGIEDSWHTGTTIVEPPTAHET